LPEEASPADPDVDPDPDPVVAVNEEPAPAEGDETPPKGQRNLRSGLIAGAGLLAGALVVGLVVLLTGEDEDAGGATSTTTTNDRSERAPGGEDAAGSDSQTASGPGSPTTAPGSGGEPGPANVPGSTPTATTAASTPPTTRPPDPTGGPTGVVDGSAERWGNDPCTWPGHENTRPYYGTLPDQNCAPAAGYVADGASVELRCVTSGITVSDAHGISSPVWEQVHVAAGVNGNAVEGYMNVLFFRDLPASQLSQLPPCANSSG
jgi:hypothetical protein